MSTTEKSFYSVPELQSRWGVSRSTVYREIRRKKLKPSHIAGTIRFAAKDVQDYERKAS